MFYVKSYSAYGFDGVLENNDVVHVLYRNNIISPFTAFSPIDWAPIWLLFTSSRDGA